MVQPSPNSSGVATLWIMVLFLMDLTANRPSGNGSRVQTQYNFQTPRNLDSHVSYFLQGWPKGLALGCVNSPLPDQSQDT